MMKNIHGIKATKQLKNMYKMRHKPNDIIQNALNIYIKVPEKQRDSYLINTFLALCLHFNCKTHESTIWNDIRQQIGRDDNASYILMLKYFTHDIAKSIQILQWIKSYDYKLNHSDTTYKKYSQTLSTIISQCDTYQQLKQIDSLVHDPHDVFIQTAFIRAYSIKYNDMDTAVHKFNSVHNMDKDVVLIGCLMKGFIHNQRYHDALSTYEQNTGIHDAITHGLALTACIHTQDYAQGKTIVSNHKLDETINDPYIQLKLIEFYGHFGDIDDALNVFNTWFGQHPNNHYLLHNMMNALMKHGDEHKALALYHECMDYNTNTRKYDGVHGLAIQCCMKSKAFEQGKDIHQQINMTNASVSLRTTLIQFYDMFGDVATAKSVFNATEDNVQNGDAIHAMLKTFINHGQMSDAVSLYEPMNRALLHKSHLLMLQMLYNNQNDAKYKRIHQILKETDDIVIKTQLIAFYDAHHAIEDAKDMFHSITPHQKDAVCIGAMMKCLINQQLYSDALGLYDEHVLHHDDVMHLLALKGCSRCNRNKGNRLSEMILSREDAPRSQDIGLYNQIIDFYGTFDRDRALQIFDWIPHDMKDAATITTLMKMYIHYALNDEALVLYDDYISRQNDISHIMAIKACIATDKFAKGHHILSRCAHNGHSIELTNTIIDFYGRSGKISSAEDIYHSMDQSAKDVVSVSCMMNAFIDNELYDKALGLYDPFSNEEALHALAIKAFGKMGQISAASDIFESKRFRKTTVSINTVMNMYCDHQMNTECIDVFDRYYETIRLDVPTHVIVLKACAQGRLLNFGQEIYDTLKTTDLVNEASIQCGLIDMFGKCGMIEVCQQILSDSKRGIAVLNAMIMAFGRNGDVESAKQFYDTNIKPLNIADRQTFIYLLNSCSHCGELKDAQNIWKNEIQDEKLKYNPYVISSFVDCLARNGMIECAWEVYLEYKQCNGNNMNHQNDQILLLALLNGCKQYNNQQLAQTVYDEIQSITVEQDLELLFE
eukprot:79610_1